MIGKRGADFSCFHHAVIDKSQSARQDVWCPIRPEELVVREQLCFDLDTCLVSLFLGQFCPVQATLEAAKWRSLLVKRS